MKSYISIIYAKSNKFTSEKLAVALLYFSSIEVNFLYSKIKLEIIQELLGEDVKNFLIENFTLIENKVKELDYQLKNQQIQDDTLTKNYFEYLNKYSKGLLLFDKLKPLNTSLINHDLKDFLIQFIEPKKTNINNTTYTKSSTGIQRKNDFYIIKIDNIKKTRTIKAKKEITVSPDDLEGILKPVHLMAAFKYKDIIELFKEINLEKRNNYIYHNLYELKILRDALSNKFNCSKENIEINLVSSKDLSIRRKNELEEAIGKEFNLCFNYSDCEKKLDKMNKEVKQLFVH